MIKHHVKEEEKRSEGLFAQAREAGLDMDALGERIMARKEELMAQFKPAACRRRRPAASPATSWCRASPSPRPATTDHRASVPLFLLDRDASS